MEERATRAIAVRRLRHDAAALHRGSRELRSHSEELRKRSARLLALSDEIRGQRPPVLTVRS